MTQIGRHVGSTVRRAALFLFIPVAFGAFGVACEPPTSFQGEAKVAGGPRACVERCRSQNMVMAAFVYVGEFSTACACAPRPEQGMSSNEGATSAAVVAAATGVETQRRIAEQEAAQRNNSYVLAPH
ncbi:MAG TPA: hypothetical protein VGI10_01335 [Polyangiaceae bacterium]